MKDPYIHLGEAMRPAGAARGALCVELLHDHAALLIPLPPRASWLEEEALNVAAHEGIRPILALPTVGCHHEQAVVGTI